MIKIGDNITAIRAGKFSVGILDDKKVCVWGLKGRS